ncbi:hypothetical protein [Rhodococcus qingshengii]|uniref:hypothetical protein n=2 Tax=Rhodococcus TaxID=1827 RepID=UPI00071CAEB6|nr:hypothetical protein [Rhodococcus qingshengii]ANQ75588.1 hypothetical protein AOT96_31685 [Rhodococcus sp. 008]KSU70574.1 hypothetical protein AS032_26870 [Rhodococcus qingshengii]SCC63978.1 hypothetical protein GA0061093_11736 [Rhodococcus qingshengii]
MTLEESVGVADRTEFMSAEQSPGGQRPQQEWLWNEQRRGWDRNPAYVAQHASSPASAGKVNWRGLLWLAAAVVVAAYLLNAWSTARNEDRHSQEGSTAPADTVSENSFSPITSAGSDGSVRAALERAGVTPGMVTALGIVGDEAGYGISKSVPMNQEQREDFAYAIVLLCRDIGAGETSWENSLNEDLFSGAELSDAQRLNDYARTEFCPLVRDDPTTPAAGKPSAAAGASPVLLTAAVAAEGRTVNVSGAVPLPDGARLAITLSRIEYFGFGDEKHYGQSASGSAVVTDGRFSATLVDDQGKARAFAEAYNAGEPAQRQIRVSDLVQVQVVFDPRENQSSAVISAVGGDDAQILESSPQGAEFGTRTDDPYWRLELESELLLPFEP